MLRQTNLCFALFKNDHIFQLSRQRLLRECLAFAREAGYRTCYLETLTSMEAAQKLYRKLGFQPLPKPMGATGHFGCDRWYALKLG